ncbi:MAG: BNR repeat-containing protein [Chitinophagaceae bacterium]|nr:BNR repeat-containing protein [Chitinophagaceae bacterium]
MNKWIAIAVFSFVIQVVNAQSVKKTTLVDVDFGWAHNSVNTVVFRKNSLVTWKDTQFIAFYNEQQFVVIGKRKTGTANWLLQQTVYKGNTADAHNMISIMIDGTGYLHLSWDHHNNSLNYCKSNKPGSLEMTDKISMTGLNEKKVSYPEFYKLPGGNLLFFYRDGGSGKGNLVINQYSIKTKEWKQLHSNLIDGEGKRNAYWQACVDAKGTIHVSWVWRESPDVASNHDMCYARSADGGKTWMNSVGKKYQLPITAATAEYALQIPQQSELINQTSMFADASGNPYIASYWREKGDSIPQYHLIYKKGKQWQAQNLGFRKTAFSLSGAGTKRIPISRPQIIAWTSGKTISVAVIFRDEERGGKISAAVSSDINRKKWVIKDLLKTPVGSWEPSYDTELWKQKRILHLFVQKTDQADGEGKSDMKPQMVQVLEWKPGN